MIELKLNQEVIICFDTAEGKQELTTRVSEIRKDRFQVENTNETIANAHLLNEGDEVLVKIITPVGIFSKTSMIINSPIEGFFVLEYNDDNFMEQRREFSRSAVEKPLILTTEHQTAEAETIDISGNGASFRSNSKFAEQEQVQCVLYLAEPINFIGKIVRVFENGEYALTIETIDEIDRDKIIKLCTQIDAELLKQNLDE